ncbi:MAG: hypothetical protein NVV59_01450 [Chitinophagaceae bacterium]|nr:hypothetical protein [Chitinophagaceae bacterium]
MYKDMTEQKLTTSVLLTHKEHSLGVITPRIRMITVEWEEIKLFRIRAYYDVAPSDEDIEDMNAVCTEIDSDIPFERNNVECIYSTEAIKDLEVFKFVVYLRKEK